MSLPDPYYQNDRVTIYHGDCREILPQLGPVDLVLTDPPWKAQSKGLTRRGIGVTRTKAGPSGQSLSYGDVGQFDPSILRSAFEKTSHDMLVICGYKELGEVIDCLSPIRGCFVWHKPNGGISVAYPAPLDLAYIVWGAHTSKLTGFQHWKSCVFSHAVPTAGCISNGERFKEGKNGKALHPCQGPLSLYRQLLKPTEGSVLDPYCGTGTTLHAAQLEGRRAIGIELEEKYCEIAAERCRQKVLF